jgi:hypothetical protein
MEYMGANPDKPWNWSVISHNPNLTVGYIDANPDKPWDWYCISWNKFNLDKHVLKNIDKKIKYRELCFNVIEPIFIPEISYIIVMYL